MRRDDGEGFEKQATTRVEKKSGRLTGQTRVEHWGRRDQLLGRLLTRPGPLSDAVKRELREWQRRKSRPVAGYRTELP